MTTATMNKPTNLVINDTSARPAMKPVRKAIIAAAGFGTRFLPQTKSIPKEMLPIVDKPIIQYVVEELVDAGIRDIIIVTGSNKRSLEDHFDSAGQDLIANLKSGGAKKAPLISELDRLAQMANFIYIRQKGPYGNATPLINAAHLIGDEPFIYTFADDFVTASPTRFRQMISHYNDLGGPVLTCVKVDKDEDFDRYGIVAGEEIKPGVLKMSNIIEKPGKANAPSSLASVSSYLLTSDIFKYLIHESDTLEAGKELYLQPGIQRMIDDGIDYFACEIVNGKYNDSGNKLDYLKTVVEFALARDDIGAEFRKFLKNEINGRK